MMNKNIRHCFWGILTLGALYACSENNEPTLQLHSEADLSGLTITTSAGTYYDQKYSQ